jgi:shikimate kinase
MGAGKTAVGRQLARRLKRDFFDSDQEIEKRTGVDIAFIFDKEGEAGFRRREREVLADLIRRRGIVLATGGGSILDPETRRRLGGNGFVVYLHATVGQQSSRTRLSRNRPLLDTEQPEQRLTELMGIRDPLYREVADLIVETDGRRVASVTEEIVRQLKRHSADEEDPPT